MPIKMLAATVSTLVVMAALNTAFTHDTATYPDNQVVQKDDGAAYEDNNRMHHHYDRGYDRGYDHRHTAHWEMRHSYPGQKLAYATHPSPVIKKGGSAINDPLINSADARPYGNFWR